MNTTSSTQKGEKSKLGRDSVESNLNNVQFGNVQPDERSEITQQRIPIPGTIFSKGWMKGKGWAIGLDDKRLTEWVETEEELNEKLEKGGLTLAEVSRMIYVIARDIEEQKKYERE